MARVNGIAQLSTREELMRRSVVDQKERRTVLVVEIREVYLHCSKAHCGGRNQPFPTFGQMIRDRYKTVVPETLIDFFLRRYARRNQY